MSTKFEYKLRFTNETEANNAISLATEGVKPYLYDVKVIGIHTDYGDYNEETEQYDTVVVFEGWHVDVVSSVELSFDAAFIVEPKNPIHEFAK